MMLRILVAALCVVGSNAFTFAPTSSTVRTSSSLQGAESEISFDALDGSQMRIGIIRSRWNDEHVTNLCDGCVKALKDCKVDEDNIFQTTVPGAFELPLAARFLALSGTVDAIVCVGVLIKGETMHFEYISDAVSKGIMNIGIQTSTPVIFGVLTCLNEKQVKDRSGGDNNHGYDWGKTAVEMAVLRTQAMGGKAADTPLKDLGFGKDKKEDKEKKSKGFF